MSWLSDIFGSGVKKALKDGGVIIDLRSAYEYDQGHIPRALNIPFDRIRSSINRIRGLERPLILCCSSGGHCREAADILRQAGIREVHIGGNWQSLWQIVRKERYLHP
jgi:rhodanese-related sulfurtransferase